MIRREKYIFIPAIRGLYPVLPECLLFNKRNYKILISKMQYPLQSLIRNNNLLLHPQYPFYPLP